MAVVSPAEFDIISYLISYHIFVNAAYNQPYWTSYHFIQHRRLLKLLRLFDSFSIIKMSIFFSYFITHWCWVTQICISKLIIIVFVNGLSPSWCQAFIWTNATILLIWSLGTNFSEILSEIRTFSFKKIHFNISSVKWQQLCFSLTVFSYDLVH